MRHFVWSKIEAEAGEQLAGILVRKEAERIHGNCFWWGTGTTGLGDKIREAARLGGGTLPIVFSRMSSKPQPKDENPPEVWLWTEADNAEIPCHVLVTSRAKNAKRDPEHYALACCSDAPLHPLGKSGKFDQTRYFNVNLNRASGTLGEGKRPGPSQVTALLSGDPNELHETGAYQKNIIGVVMDPHVVKLVKYRILDAAERTRLNEWSGGDWLEFVRGFRR